jgi:hypothetical protein
VRILSERLRQAVSLIDELETRVTVLEGRRSPLEDEIGFDALAPIPSTPSSAPIKRDSEWDKMDKLDDELDTELRREGIDN